MFINIKKAIYLIPIVLVLLVVLGIKAFYPEKPQSKDYKILYIASYHPEFTWVMDVQKGIKQAFKDKKIPIVYKSFYMDTKRRSKPEEIQQSAKEAREFIKKWNPDLVIVSDDNATKFVALEMQDTKYKFVFCGVNNEPEAYGLPKKNITGVLERHRFKDAVKILKILAPHTKKILVISEKSPSADLIISQLREKTDKIPAEIVAIKQTNSFQEWQTIIKSNQNNIDAFMIILYSTLKDNQGVAVPGAEVINWTVSNSDIPEVGIFPFMVESGGLVADAVKGFSQGYTAAEMAVEILKGANPLNMEIKSTTDGIIYINASRAKELRIIIPINLYQSSRVIWRSS